MQKGVVHELSRSLSENARSGRKTTRLDFDDLRSADLKHKSYIHNSLGRYFEPVRYLLRGPGAEIQGGAQQDVEVQNNQLGTW